MKISKIQLSNFRNFKKKVLSFSAKTTVIVGPNASGKTNIMEALFLLSTGKSFRARVEEEMISYDAEIARISAELGIKNNELRKDIRNTKYKIQNSKLEVVLTRGEINIGTTKQERVARKKLLINGVGKRLIDFAGNFKVVLFGPHDLGLVTESPSVRRKFLDTVLSQVDREYRRATLSYEKGLRQRNRLLFQIREDPSASSGRTRLLFWDRLLVKNGDYVSRKREEFIDFTNSTNPMDEQEFSLEYDKSAISEARLEQYKREEVAAATTLVGPHRDDFVFKLKTLSSKLKTPRDLARYGSRGEQRMGVLWLKLAELAYIEKETHSTSSGQAGEKPTLLLDDIFSELDHEHREVVMRVVRGEVNPVPGGTGWSPAPTGAGQAIITTADPHFVEPLRNIEKIKI